MSFFKKNLFFKFIILLSFSIALYAIIIYGFLPLGEKVHPDMKQVYSIEPIGIYTHIFSSSIALILGPFLLHNSFRDSYPKLHQRLGKTYIILGVMLGGISGLYMSYYAFGGLVSTFGFGLLAILWIFTGVMGVIAIYNQNYQEHKKWMYRNYALTFAAVTIRIYIGVFFASGMSFEVFYPMLSWLCWVPNLLLVEWLVLKSTYNDEHIKK